MVVFFAMIVMPRSRSSSMESITRSATCSLARKIPLWCSMASTRVVLPWSTWAMIAILRMSSRRFVTDDVIHLLLGSVAALSSCGFSPREVNLQVNGPTQDLPLALLAALSGGRHLLARYRYLGHVDPVVDTGCRPRSREWRIASRREILRRGDRHGGARAGSRADIFPRPDLQRRARRRVRFAQRSVCPSPEATAIVLSLPKNRRPDVSGDQRHIRGPGDAWSRHPEFCQCAGLFHLRRHFDAFDGCPDDLGCFGAFPAVDIRRSQVPRQNAQELPRGAAADVGP